MRPYTKRITTDGIPVEIMTRVLDDEPNVLVPSKVDCELNVSYCSGFDNILWPTALGTI